jgi:hypothetical protein
MAVPGLETTAGLTCDAATQLQRFAKHRHVRDILGGAPRSLAAEYLGSNPLTPLRKRDAIVELDKEGAGAR